MKLSKVIEILKENIPKKETWTPCKNEPYGEYNINLDNDKEVQKILYCVTASDKVSEYFRENNYDLLVSHHPIFADKGIPQLIFHTALDCCKDGLNDFWKDFLNIKNPKHFYDNLGWYGEINSISFNSLCKKIENQLESKIFGAKINNTEKINSVVICTGMGGMVNDKALKTDADCYILGQCTGNPKNSGFRSLIEIGHTLSERNGFNLIEKLLKNKVLVDMVPLEKDICCYGEKYKEFV